MTARAFSAIYECEARTRLIAAAVGDPPPLYTEVAHGMGWPYQLTYKRVQCLISAGAISVDRTRILQAIPTRKPPRDEAPILEHFTCQCGASCVVGQISALHQPMLCSTCRADRVEAIIAARRLAA